MSDDVNRDAVHSASVALDGGTLTIPETVTMTKKEEDDLLHVSLRGTPFSVSRSVLRRFPTTRLARLDETDPSYEDSSGCYEFDHNPAVFHNLLDFYRDGEYHLSAQARCHGAARAELLFWGLEPQQLAACCYDAYEQDNERRTKLVQLRESLRSPIERFRDAAAKNRPRSTGGRSGRRSGRAVVGVAEKDTGGSSLQVHTKDAPAVTLGSRDKAWAFFEDPRSSMAALVWSVLVALAVYLSLVTIALETLPEMRNWENATLYQIYLNETRSKALWLLINTGPNNVIFSIDIITTAILFFDISGHFWSSRNKKALMLTASFVLEGVVVTAMILMVIVRKLPGGFVTEAMGTTRLTLIYIGGTLRLLRAVLLVKLRRSYRMFYILFASILKSWREMFLLVFVITVGMMVFSVAVFYAELFEDTFNDMFESYWWALVTMTTVGYGDITPKTTTGRVLGAGCVICGVIIIAIPVAVIGGNFAQYYSMVATMDRLSHQRAKREEMDIKRPQSAWQ